MKIVYDDYIVDDISFNTSPINTGLVATFRCSVQSSQEITKDIALKCAKRARLETILDEERFDDADAFLLSYWVIVRGEEKKLHVTMVFHKKL